MKNIFGFNMDAGANAACGENMDGKSFILRRAAKDTEDLQQDALNDANAAEKRAYLPLWLRIIEWVCGVFAFIAAAGLLKSLPDVSVKQMYVNAAWVFYAGGVCAVVWAVLFVCAVIKRKKAEKSPQTAAVAQRLDEVVKISEKELAIPPEADETDIFIYCYKLKNGKVKKINSFAEYFNFQFKIFAEGENLCLSEMSMVVAIRLDEIKRIVKTEKRVSFFGWNKKTQFNKDELKQYKIKRANTGVYFVKTYYSVHIERGGEEYEILFPPYEIATFLKYVDLKKTEFT